MRVSDILRGKSNDIISLQENETVATAARLLAEKKIGAVVVLSVDDGLAGILSERDIIGGLSTRGADILAEPVSRIMTADVKTCTKDEPVQSLMQRMTEGRFRHLPVMDDETLIGMISIGDVVKNHISVLEQEKKAMREYITGSADA